MNRAIELEKGKYGPMAVITGHWSDEIASDLASLKIMELELNYAKGWRGSDLSFLSNFPWLQRFKITDFKITSVDPVHELQELRSLEIATYCDTELRFSIFPMLVDCSLEWRDGAISLFDCLSLEALFVNRYTGKNADLFGRLTKLQSLAILNAPLENIRGLSSLKELRSLRLANLERLASLEGIESLKRLEELEINTCRAIRDLDALRHLSQLRVINLNNNGKISNLKPLEHLDKLETVNFYESTDIADGDLSPLTRLPRLSRSSFKNRKHYSHRREELKLLRSKDS